MWCLGGRVGEWCDCLEGFVEGWTEACMLCGYVKGVWRTEDC